MDFVSPVIDLWKCIMVPTCNQVEHHRILGERMQELRTKGEVLEGRKTDIERRKQTEVHSDQEVKKEVELWLRHVEAIMTEIQKVEEKFQNVSFFSRSRLSKRVQMKIVEVDKILEREFPSIVIDMPPARGLIFPIDGNANAEGDQNRVRFRDNLEEKIMGYLMGDDVGIIGVCGPGGVGKTTLAKSINNKVSNLEDSKFEKVIWAPLPYPFNIVKLQDTIVVAMNENLPERGSEEGRAAKLLEIMRKVKFLLILDDAWDRFSFEDVGIPVPTLDNGCKVVITSRLTQLCKYIGCNDNGLVNVKTLSEKESLSLFLDTVGRDVILKIPNLEETLRDLVKGCAGLPLAIVVIAKSMRGENDISGWRNAVNELRSCVESVKGWDDEIFERLKFSYHRLKDEELQNCFLFCSLYPKSWDLKENELIECWIDGGLIKKMKTRKAMVDRGRAILNRLVSDCLIEDVKEGFFRGHVRMHDVMRDMALRVASSRFMVKAGEELLIMTGNDEWTEHLEKVSMIGCRILKISPDFCPNCPKLSVLLLSTNYGLRMIPDSFFKGMLSLTYLNLSSSCFSNLPNSISNLSNLTALQLRNMQQLKYVPSLAELKALKKLDLMGTGIEVVPEGIEVLVNLEHLDLRCKNLVEFPIQTLKDLSRLEFFSGFALSCLSSTDFVSETGQVPSRLQMLETFYGEFRSLESFTNYVKFFHRFQKLNQYLLLVGDFKVDIRFGNMVYADIVELSKKVIIQGLNIQGKHFELLPYDLQHLTIENCYGVKSLSETSLLNTETDLRSCQIRSCSFQCILDLDSPSSVCSVFDKCEVLNLSCLSQLHALIKGAPRAPSIFFNLKELVVSYCPRIKKLIQSTLLKWLHNLEEIHVSDCDQMEEIIELEGEENETSVTFNLPKLRKLVLTRLPRLKSICSVKGVMICDFIQIIDISVCPKLHRIPLYLPRSSPPPSLQEIKLDTRTWEVLDWDDPATKEILLPFFKPRSGSDARSLTWGSDFLLSMDNAGLGIPQSTNIVTVFNPGSFGRSLDISKFSCYPELRSILARLFNLESELEDPQRSGWKLVYVDQDNDFLLLDDDPWQEFVSSVQYIKILSPQQVQQIKQIGLRSDLDAFQRPF